MMKFNMKIKGTSSSNGQKPHKVKVPKIEINECKVKTKDQKKLENEMFQQAKEAQLMLEQLLCEDRYDEFGRPRSNSLNATVENILLSKKTCKNTSKPRGSVPTLSNIPRKLLIRQNKNNQQPASLPCSPNQSRKNKMNPLNFIRKYSDHVDMSSSSNSECRSPKSKRAFEPPTDDSSAAECISFKTMNIGTNEQVETKVME